MNRYDTKMALADYRWNYSWNGHPVNFFPVERTPPHLFVLGSYVFPNHGLYSEGHQTLGAFIDANLPKLDEYLDKPNYWLLAEADAATNYWIYFLANQFAQQQAEEGD